MCGIVGYIGKNNNALEVLIEGLEKLEYRGYDSAGVAFINNNELNILKEQGKILNLKDKIDFNVNSNLGIGHTRWATHGEPNYCNSHPHKVGKITIVHNGIIENYVDLKRDLIEKGYQFESETDTEVACALLDNIYQETNNMITTLEKFKNHTKGAYALGIICDDDLENLYAIKKDSPLIIALGKDENYVASDVPAILKYTSDYIVLDEGEFAKISDSKITLYDKDNNVIEKEIRKFAGNANDLEKNGYDHYMLKEIYEQPDVIKRNIETYISKDINQLTHKMPDFTKYSRIDIVACGSAMHAGLVGKSLIETYGNIPVNVEIASEYRYKKLFLNEKVLVILISQSGETADTLAALKIAKEHGSDTLGIINVEESSIARNVDYIMYTKAGSEIAVATTKAYSAQLFTLALIALNMMLKTSNKDELSDIVKNIKKLPIEMQKLLDKNHIYKEIAKKVYKNNDVFFLGRGIDYALAMEGSLKLKEISYTHSEAYPAGELKHGTISLVEQNTPVIAIITDENIAEKTISNLKEVKARGANVILITTEKLDHIDDFYDQKIVIPTTSSIIEPLLVIIPLQLISYEIAKLKLCDIDKPKNLAKSVTVE